MAPRFSTTQLESMAWTIDRDGIDAIPTPVLRELGFAARRIGLRPDVTDLLADPSAPRAVRNRAFGLIARLLGRPVEQVETASSSPQLADCAA